MLRNARRVALALVAACALFGLHIGRAVAQGTFTITVDENCNGTFGGAPLLCSPQQDPGPSGLANAVTFTLPNGGVTPGDWVVFAADGSAPGSDLIRFNGNGTLVFYSDVPPSDGADALADIGFPQNNYNARLFFREVGLEGNDGLTYTPVTNEPGFLPGAAFPVTYVIISDAIPEPSSLALLASGLGLLAVSWRRRRERTQLAQLG